MCLATLDDWQVWHSLHQRRMSFLMPCQTKRAAKARVVGRAATWARSWTDEKTRRRQVDGTRGRAAEERSPTSQSRV